MTENTLRPVWIVAHYGDFLAVCLSETEASFVADEYEDTGGVEIKKVEIDFAALMALLTFDRLEWKPYKPSKTKRRLEVKFNRGL